MTRRRDIKRRLMRVGEVLAFLSEEDRLELRKEHQLAPEEVEETVSDSEKVRPPYLTDPVPSRGKFRDDATAAGPHNESPNSRYKLEPGHSQSLSDVLSKTAQRILRVLS